MKPDCCVDLVGAQHIKHDLLVHFGNACFSGAASANIVYVLPRKTLSVGIPQLKDMIAQLNEKHVLVLAEQCYQWQMGQLEDGNVHVLRP